MSRPILERRTCNRVRAQLAFEDRGGRNEGEGVRVGRKARDQGAVSCREGKPHACRRRRGRGHEVDRDSRDEGGEREEDDERLTHFQLLVVSSQLHHVHRSLFLTTNHYPLITDIPSAGPMLADILQPLSQAVLDRGRRLLGAATRQPRKLRIGVDIRPFYEPLTGVGWYLHHLLHALAKYEEVELYLFGDARVTDRGPRIHCDLPQGAHLCTFDLRGRGEISRLTRAASAAAYVAWMKLVDCDVMFGANYFLPRLHAAVARRRVVTVHDLTYKRFPELLQNETLANLENHMARELAQAEAVICVSESTRRDLLRYYPIDPRRAVTVLSGVAVPPLAGAPGALAPLPEGAGLGATLPKKYILFVSTIEPRKNLTVLLDAFEDLKRRGRLHRPPG